MLDKVEMKADGFAVQVKPDFSNIVEISEQVLKYQPFRSNNCNIVSGRKHRSWDDGKDYNLTIFGGDVVRAGDWFVFFPGYGVLLMRNSEWQRNV